MSNEELIKELIAEYMERLDSHIQGSVGVGTSFTHAYLLGVYTVLRIIEPFNNHNKLMDKLYQNKCEIDVKHGWPQDLSGDPLSLMPRKGNTEDEIVRYGLSREIEALLHLLIELQEDDSELLELYEEVILNYLNEVRGKK